METRAARITSSNKRYLTIYKEDLYLQTFFQQHILPQQLSEDILAQQLPEHISTSSSSICLRPILQQDFSYGEITAAVILQYWSSTVQDSS